MFGLGRRKNDDARRVQALTQELEQVQHTLLEQTQRAEKAESQAAFLASQNRALAAKVHRLALQRIELLNDKDRVERENKELQITNLQLDNEARVAKSAKADAWQVPNLKAALRQQAAQHEKKLASMKRRTKALLTAILPGVHSKAGGGLLAAPCSPISDSGEVEVEDLWDAPLSLAAPSTPNVYSRIRDIVTCLYDDTITEEDALAQMTALTQTLVTQSGSTVATSRGCSPLPMPKIATDESAAAAKVDAATDPQTARVRHVADAATETPAEVSCIGTPRDVSAAPSQGPASPRRLVGAGVPVLDLAALVAQAMEEAPLSGRSTVSTSTSTVAGPSFSSISQFVLAQPEKLQRLIMRHAAATGAKSGLGLARAAQSPFGTGLPPSAAAATAVGTHDLYSASSCVSLMEPLAQLSSGGVSNLRPSLTSRLLGLSGSSAANRAAAAAAPPQAAVSTGNNATAGMGSTSGVTVSPIKPAKRPGAAPPKFAKLGGPDKPSEPAGPVLSMPGAKLLTGYEDNHSSSGNNFSFGNGLPVPQVDLDSDFKDLSLASGALGFFQPGGSRR